MCSCRGGADHVDAKPLAKFSGFRVEVVDDFQVVGDEAEWHDHHIFERRFLVARFDEIADIGFQPWLLRRAAAALIDEGPVVETGPGGDERRRRAQVRLVWILRGHR